jgi:hypothetical protein
MTELLNSKLAEFRWNDAANYQGYLNPGYLDHAPRASKKEEIFSDWGIVIDI